MLEYCWLFALLLRSARYFPGAEGKWIPLPPMLPPSSPRPGLGLYIFLRASRKWELPWGSLCHLGWGGCLYLRVSLREGFTRELSAAACSAAGRMYALVPGGGNLSAHCDIHYIYDSKPGEKLMGGFQPGSTISYLCKKIPLAVAWRMDWNGGHIGFRETSCEAIVVI